MGQRAHGVLDLRADFLSSSSDAFERRHFVRREQRGGASTRSDSVLRVWTDDGNLVFVGFDGEDLVLVLEEYDGVGAGFAKESADLGCVEGLLWGVEWDTRVVGALQKAKNLKVYVSTYRATKELPLLTFRAQLSISSGKSF